MLYKNKDSHKKILKKGARDMTDIPRDPVMLLSFVNTQLRDHYHSLDEFAAVYQCRREEIEQKLKEIDYEYDPEQNRFI